jgi:hypothetical protein
LICACYRTIVKVMLTTKTAAQRRLLDAIARADRPILESLLDCIVTNPELYEGVADAAKSVGLLCPDVDQSTAFLRPCMKRKTHQVSPVRVQPSLSVLAATAKAVVSSVLFPFLGVTEHVRLASTSRSMLSVSGIPPPACMCVKPETWKNRIKLQTDVTGEQFRRLCLVARPLALSMRWCDKIVDSDLAYLKPVALEELDLACSQITDAALVHLQHLPLRKLDFSHCFQIAGAGFAMLKHAPLQELNLAYCGKVTDSALVHLQHLPLRKLNLSWTEITDHALVMLQDMPLEELCLAGCTNITTDGLYRLQPMRLTYLDLSWVASVTDAVLFHLQHMPLQFLHLEYCKSITDAGLAHLQHMPLQSLNLEYCISITDAGLAHLQDMPLQSLNLAQCVLITDGGLARLQCLPLQNLRLKSCTLITDAGLAHLRHLQAQKDSDCTTREEFPKSHRHVQRSNRITPERSFAIPTEIRRHFK